MAEAREELLNRILDDVAGNGLADRSLRDMAAAVDSSHRMLLYHFGSREGLVMAIVAKVEASQRELMASIEPSTDRLEVAREMWRRVSDPELRPFVQLFFEAAAYASRSGSDRSFTQDWIDEAAELTEKMDQPFDRAEARLGVAVVRGLLVDVITGGNLDEATASFERFLAMWAASP